jgi:hypothetical protein
MSDRQKLTPPQGHDVAAALPELVDLFCRGTSGDGGVGPVGRLQDPGEDDLARGVQDSGAPGSMEGSRSSILSHIGTGKVGAILRRCLSTRLRRSRSVADQGTPCTLTANSTSDQNR